MIRIPQSAVDAMLEGDWSLSDLTTEGLGELHDGRITGTFKTPGIIAGLPLASRIFETTGCTFTAHVAEGDRVEAKVPLFTVEGTAEQIHAAYKLGQCVMEYASGIAMRTRAMLDAARAVDPKVRVSGTRKHMPGGKLVSLLGLYAGGGILHRAGLSDSILVFDQHRVLADDPHEAVRGLVEREIERKVAVEVDSLEEALRYASLGVGIIQFEKFEPSRLKEAVDELRRRYPHVTINAAGGINAENAALYAAAGVDVLVTSWPYFGKPHDVKMTFSRRD